MVQGKDDARPISIEGQKQSTATVWQAQDVVIREIHVIRGYNLLNKAHRYAGLEDHDIAMLKRFSPANIGCENFSHPYGRPFPLQIDPASSSKHLVILFANQYVPRPCRELLQNLQLWNGSPHLHKCWVEDAHLI